MKMRQGFVSNSSSSSFLVGFKHKPTSQQELMVMMFGDDFGNNHCPHCGGGGIPEPYGDGIISFKDIAAYVWRDLELAEELTSEMIANEVDSGYIREVDELTGRYPEHLKGDTPDERQQKWTEYEKKHREASAKFASHLPFKGLHVFVFSYSDNDGSFESNMEHGDVFRNLPRLHISHH